MKHAIVVLAVFVATLLMSASACQPPQAPHTLTAIRTDIFSPRCGATVCHGGSGPVRGLDLLNDPFGTAVGVASIADPSILRVSPGDAEHSLLFLVLSGPQPDTSGDPTTNGTNRQMPIGVTLDPDDLDRIKQWIDEGALNN